MAHFEVLDHTADTGISASAGSLAELVETMATAMFSLMATISPCPSDEMIEFEVIAKTAEDLVFECLSELLYLAETKDLVFCAFHAGALGERGISMTARGVPSDRVELTGPPIKAVTYHEMEVVESGEVWKGQVYFDV